MSVQTSPSESPQAPDAAPVRGLLRWRGVRWYHERGVTPLLVLLALIVVVSAYDPGFLQLRSILALVDQTAVIALLALAQAVVVFTGRITLANAALASLAGVLMAQLLPSLGVFAVILVLAGAVVYGVVLGLLHVVAQVPSFIITLGGLGVAAGLALWVSGAESVFVDGGYSVVEWISFRLYGIPIGFLLTLVVAAALMAVFGLLPFGRSVRAIGFNERAAGFSGIRTGRVVVLVFAVSGLLSGLAAVVQVAQLESAGPTTSDSLLLPSIAAVILGGSSLAGGIGGIGRTILGAFIVSMLRVGLDLVGIDPAIQPIIYGAIVIIAVAATVDRSRGTVVA